MESIIGGAYQGKKETAKRLFGLQEEEILDGASCGPEKTFQAKAVCNFHLLIRSMMEQKQDVDIYFETLKYQNPDIILISNEIGYGIVPLDRFERDWREKTGRICCLAAQESRSVIRVLAGNPVYIKGEQWT